ncbi:MAG: hypothetical protein ACUVRQ_09050 [Thermoanaerobaculaceae bacterium]
MVQFRPAAREIVAKIVYYGPSLGGKTTNLRKLWEGYPPEVRGELIVLPTGADRTIFFDYLPLTFHKLRGLEVRIQLYTVPGQVRFNSTRQVVLKGVDGVVFVADSQREAAAANKESWLNLKNNLSKQGLFLDHLPHVLQYNKRDLADIIPVEDLDAELNEYNAPFFEAVAIQGIGVEETLQGIVRLVIRSLRDRFNLTVEAPGGPRPSPLPVSQVTAPQRPEANRDEQQTGRVSVVPFSIPRPEVTPPTLPFVKLTETGKVSAPVELTTSTGAARASAEGEPPSEAAYPSEGVSPSEGSGALLGVTSAEAELPKVPLGVEVLEEGAVSPSAPTFPVAQETATTVPAGLTSPVFEPPPFSTQEAAPSQEPWLELPPPPGEGEIGLAQAREDAATMPVFSGEEAPTLAPETTTWEEPFSLVEEPQAPPTPVDVFAVAPVEPIFEPEKGEIGETSTVDQLRAAGDELEPGSQLPPEAVVQLQGVGYGEPAFGEPVVAAGVQTSAPGEAFPLGSGELPGPDPFPMAPVASAGPLAGEDVFAIVPAPFPEVVPPKVALEKVLPKVVARHGEVRELEVEVPVPAVWVGGRRVALQLRLILVPEEENHEP